MVLLDVSRQLNMASAAHTIFQRIDQLAEISEDPANLTRTFASPAMLRANQLVAEWMRAAGMTTRVDAIGNLIGHYDGASADARVLLMGSHLDTVRDAGKYDGPLGVILAIACVEHLHRHRQRLPFAIEVVGFSDEEGVRYQTTYLGSRALAGKLGADDLQRADSNGVTIGQAIEAFGGGPAGIAAARLDPARILAYIEAHIEQGPVLESHKLPLGVVTAISGQVRARVTFTGHAGHAGTTPMHLRRDALCAAAEWILATERLARETPGATATVGEIAALPGASNVIPGAACLTLDVRHGSDTVRKALCTRIRRAAAAIARERGIKLRFEVVHQAASVTCARELTDLLGEAVARHQPECLRLASGAGHDAAIMGTIAPTAMLFIRCRRGISHNPAEAVKPKDVEIAFDVLNDFLQRFAAKCGMPAGKPTAKIPKKIG